jgi:hypothetical protein
MKLFVENDDTVSVKVYFYQDLSGILYVWTDNFTVYKFDNPKVEITTQEFVFRYPNFAEQIAIDDFAKQDFGLSKNLDDIVFYVYKLTKLLVSWTLTDEERKPIPLEPATILKMDPKLLNVLIAEMKEIFA